MWDNNPHQEDPHGDPKPVDATSSRDPPQPAAGAKIDLFMNRFLNGHPYMCRMTDISPTGARIIPIIEPTAVARRPRTWGCSSSCPGVTKS